MYNTYRYRTTSFENRGEIMGQYSSLFELIKAGGATFDRRCTYALTVLSVRAGKDLRSTYQSSQCLFSKVKPERGNAVPLNYHSLLSLKSFCVLTSDFSYSYFSEMSKAKLVIRNVPGGGPSFFRAKC